MINEMRNSAEQRRKHRPRRIVLFNLFSHSYNASKSLKQYCQQSIQRQIPTTLKGAEVS